MKASNNKFNNSVNVCIVEETQNKFIKAQGHIENLSKEIFVWVPEKNMV